MMEGMETETVANGKNIHATADLDGTKKMVEDQTHRECGVWMAQNADKAAASGSRLQTTQRPQCLHAWTI